MPHLDLVGAEMNVRNWPPTETPPFGLGKGGKPGGIPVSREGRQER